MPTSPMSEFIRHLRSTLLPDGADLTDGQLLDCFVSDREPAALEALVRRHGPMVWGVCRRVLLNPHDAEDAFQATFLVLVRKAASIRCRAKVGNWLYGVAHQTALKARANRAKRKMRETQVSDMPEPAATGQDSWSDLQAVLDEELSRLPEKYRTVIVLCELEGKAIKEAARQLSLAQGTAASRLARARAMLAKRLAHRGVTLSGATLAAVLSEKAASAALPSSVMSSTIKTVTLVAVGQAAATTLVSAKVAALTEGVVKAMLLTKLKIAAALVVVLALTGLGVGFAILPTPATEPAKEQQANPKPRATKAEPADQGKQVKSDLEKLQGTWRLVSSESDGLTFSEGRKEVKDTRLVIDKSSLKMSGKLFHSHVKLKPEDVTAVGTIALDAKQNPKQIVFTWETNPWLEKDYLTQRGIYTLDGENLKLCFYFPGSDTKALIPTEFSANAGSKRNLGTWKRVLPSVKESRPETKPPLDLSKIQPSGGVPLNLGRPGTKIKVDGIERARKRLEAVPREDLEKWVVELERLIDQKLKDGLPSPRQVCRTDFVIHMSVAFDDLKWNAKTADKLFKRAQTMPASEVKAWKEAFEALLKKKIGQTDTEVLDGGPAWAVPLVLIPVDAFYEGQKYSAERGKRYLARLKQLTLADVSLWEDRVDDSGGTKLDAAVNIVLLDDFFYNEEFQWANFRATLKQQEKKKTPTKEREEENELQGTWKLVSLEFDGLRVGEGRPELKDARLRIEEKSLTFFLPYEEEPAQSPQKVAVADFTLDRGQTPHVIVLTWKECPWNGKKDFVQKSIYAVDGNRLKLCLSRKDEDKEAVTEFSANADSKRLLWIFKRDLASK